MICYYITLMTKFAKFNEENPPFSSCAGSRPMGNNSLCPLSCPLPHIAAVFGYDAVSDARTFARLDARH